jgi:hypothetical protein
MSREFVTAVLCLGGLVLAAAPAQSQSSGNCAMREHVIARLASAYGETRQSIGLNANNQVVEVFASSETGTWTITVTTPNGLTCLVASGQAFETITTASEAKGDDT